MSQLLTVKEVADQLRVTQQSVGNYIREKKLKAIRLGGIWRIKPDDVDNFIEKCVFKCDK